MEFDNKHLPLENYQFSTRTFNFFLLSDIKYIDQLIEYTSLDILSKRNVGRFVLNDIRKILAGVGFSLKDDILCKDDAHKKLIENIPEFLGKIKNQICSIELDLRSLKIDIDNIVIDLNSKGIE